MSNFPGEIPGTFPGQMPGPIPGAPMPGPPMPGYGGPRRYGPSQTQSSVRAIKPDWWTGFYFSIIAIICLMNLNGVLFVLFQIDRLASIIILASGLFIIGRTMSLWNQCLGPAGKWFMAFLILYVAIGATINFDMAYVISHLNSMFLIFASALVARDYARRNQTPRFLSLLTIITVLGAFTIYLSPFLGSYYANRSTLDRLQNAGRWMGFFANPNETGMAAVNGLVVCLAIWSLPPGTTKLRKYLPLIVCGLAIGVVLTFSRGSMIAFAIIGVGYALFTLRFDGRAVGTVIAGLFVFGASYWFFTAGYKSYDWTNEQKKRIHSIEKMITFEETTERDTGGRWNGIVAGLDYWQESPIVGHGLGTMHRMPEKYFGGLGCHNTHIMVLGEVGIAGTWVYIVALMIYYFRSVLVIHPAAKVFCLLVLVSFLLFGMVDHGLLDNRSFNILLGAAFGLQSIYAVSQPAQRMPIGNRRQFVPVNDR
jgi:O-Antigen ligase